MTPTHDTRGRDERGLPLLVLAPYVQLVHIDTSQRTAALVVCVVKECVSQASDVCRLIPAQHSVIVSNARKHVQ